MNFGERLINLRKQRGMSQEELAEKLNMTRQTISKWELGVSTPDMESLKNISNLFGISVDELISNNENTNTNNTANNNPEYVGLNSNYVPNSESYVKEDKSSKKIANAYIIVIIVIIALTFGMTIFGMIRYFTGWGRIKEEQKDNINKMINTSANMMERSSNITEKIEQKENKVESNSNELENQISKGIKQFENVSEESAKELLENSKEEYNKAMNTLEEKIESGEFQNQINDAKDRLQNAIKNIDFNF